MGSPKRMFLAAAGGARVDRRQWCRGRGLAQRLGPHQGEPYCRHSQEQVREDQIRCAEEPEPVLDAQLPAHVLVELLHERDLTKRPSRCRLSLRRARRQRS